MKKKSMIITNLDVSSVSKISGIVGLSIGLILGVIYSIIFGITSNFTVGLGLLIIVPIFYGAIFYLFGAFASWLYNHAAERIGGIKFDFKESR